MSVARPLLAFVCACVAMSVTSGNKDPTVEFCSNLKLGNPVGKVVVSYTYNSKADAEVIILNDNEFGARKGVVITACNPTGKAPFLVANNGTKHLSAELHCNFKEEPRCPSGIKVSVLDYFP